MRIRLTFVAPLLVPAPPPLPSPRPRLPPQLPRRLRLTRPLSSPAPRAGPEQFASHPAMSRSTTHRRPSAFIPMAAKPFCSESAVCAPSRTNHEEESQRGT